MAPARPRPPASDSTPVSPVIRVLGVDPGLAITGYGAVDGDGRDARLVGSGTIRSTTKLSRAERLARIYEGIGEAIKRFRPAELAIEQQFVATNARSAMAIGEARAAAMVAAATHGVPVFEFAPASIKELVTGWGGAPKAQVTQMVMMHLHLQEEPHPADVADALAVALTRLSEARFEARMRRA